MAQELIREYSAAEIRACTGQLSDLAMVGQGGFGRVYRAMLNLTPVAIKVSTREAARAHRTRGTRSLQLLLQGFGALTPELRCCAPTHRCWTTMECRE